MFMCMLRCYAASTVVVVPELARRYTQVKPVLVECGRGC